MGKYIELNKHFEVDDYIDVEELFISKFREVLWDVVDGELWYWETLEGKPKYYREINGKFDLEIFPDYQVNELDGKIKVVLKGVWIYDIDYDIRETYFWEAVKPNFSLKE